MEIRSTLIDESLAKKCLPLRDQNGHKGSFGKVLMIGGSTKMAGAIVLAAKAALHSGIGTLTLFIPDKIEYIRTSLYEAMLILSKSDQDGFLNMESVDDLKENIAFYDLVAIGNGLGKTMAAKALLKTALKSNKALIIDADAIWALKDLKRYLKRPYPTIITPHMKEFADFAGSEMARLIANPAFYVQEFGQEYPDVTLILKSSLSRIIKNKEIYILNRPDSALSKGGSGDVLCGILSGMLAQSHDPVKAAIVAVYVHNQTADLTYDPNFLTPSLMIANLNAVYKSLRQ